MRERTILKAACAALALLAIASIPAHSDEAAMLKYKDYLPEQIAKMPAAVRERDLPVGYIMDTRKALAPDGKLAMAMDLNVLMYPGVQDFDGAVKKFQSDLGEKPTGSLTVYQIHKLGVRAGFQRVATLGFPFMYVSNLAADTASVRGTLEIIDDRIAWPVNYVQVFCSRAQAYCEQRMLMLDLPDENGFAQMYNVSDAEKEFYKITRWDTASGNVDAVPFSDTGCRTNSLSFNFKTKEFLEITRDSARECQLVRLEKLAKPRIARIIDGEKMINAKFAEVQKKAYGFLASDFRKAVDAVNKRPPLKTQTQ